MIKRLTSHTEIKKFVFLTEQEFIMYFGQHYESIVLKANETKQDVIQVKNANGITSAIPIERANYLLEKYHKVLKKRASSPTSGVDTVVPLATETSVVAKAAPSQS